MGVLIVNLTAGFSVTPGSTFTTDSVTPVANRLYVFDVAARTADSIDTNDPTITGCNLTWVKINSVVYDRTSASRKAVALYRALGSSPTTGALTIDYGARSPTACAWSLEEVTGMDTSGTNGSGAIVQSATNWHQDTDATTINTIALAAFADSNNATFAAQAADGNPVATVSSYGTGMSGVGGAASTGDGVTIEPEWQASNNTSPSITWSKVVDLGGIAIEIKAAGAATPSANFGTPRLLTGVGT